jgi:uncharacterized RDD family membrane protein YckC
MVYDLSEPKISSDFSGSPQWRLPSLGDRLAAVVVDFGVLGLLSSLVLAPVTRQIYISKHVGDRSDIAMLYLLSFFLFVLCGIVYQTFFVYKHGATLGQKAFRIRVVNLWDGEQPSLMTALTRSIFWWLDTLLCGLPHLGVFSNTHRRPMHDRLADTIVTSIGHNTSKVAPQGWWLSSGKIIFVLIFVVGSLVFGIELSSRYYQIEALESWQEDLGTIGFEECEEVNAARDTWPEDSSRLAIAMALFSAEAANADCLEVEAYRAFKNNEELDLAYLTRAFSRNEDPELSDAYLQKVCEVAKTEDETCVFSRLIESWTEKDWDSATKIFSSLLPNSRAFVKIWAIKHFERTKDFAKELEIIEQLGPRQALSEFMGTHRAVALWGLHRKSEAKVAMSVAMENMVSPERLNLASWFCYRELLDSCDASTGASCSVFAKDIRENEELLAQSGIAVTMLRFEECHSGRKINYDELADRIPGTEAALLISASKFLSESKSQDAIVALKKLSHTDSERVFAAEAQMRLVQALDSEDEMNEVITSWKNMDHSVWEWRRLGRAIFDRLREKGQNSQAFALGMQILDNDPNDRELMKGVVVAGYKAGLKLEAWNVLKAATDTSRKLASQDDFQDVEHLLLEQFAKGVQK